MSISTVPDDLYSSIAALVNNPRQLESLTRVKQACDYLATNRVKITPTSVERYCLDRGWPGPKAQSIRNSPGVLAKYLHTRCAGQTVPRAQSGTAVEPVIHDETLRAYVMLLTQERDQAVAARTRIEKALRSIPGIPSDDLIRAGFGQQPAAPFVSTPVLPAEVVRAIGLLFNAQALEQCGLELFKDRIRQSTTRNVLLNAESVKALRGALDGPTSSSKAPAK